MTKTADFTDEQVQPFLGAMKPITIVFLGVAVGGAIIAMYLSIIDIMNAVGA